MQWVPEVRLTEKTASLFWQVMPLNDEVGIIEWMERTQPLKAVILGQVDPLNRGQTYDVANAKAAEVYQQSYHMPKKTLYLPKMVCIPLPARTFGCVRP